MKRFFLCLVAACATQFTLFSQSSSVHLKTGESLLMTENDSLHARSLDEVVILSNRASKFTPVAQTNLEASEIQLLTVANNLPHLLWMTPSLVATSENGTGSGYSSFRIRGTDASRINVTLNGIPLNNPESQEVYWVNIPDMNSALQSIQVQRGVGTSTNGSGAFGASINMTTGLTTTDMYLESATTAGSYGMFQQNLAFGTGLFGKGCSLNLRYSNLTTDGYVRNGWCDHESLFASFVKRFKKSGLRLNYIYGNQHTGITWEGISKAQMDADPTYNPAGEITDGVYYDNESDNYRQHHIQAFYTHELSNYLLLNAGLNYTDGFGYYEQYKQDKSFASMGIADQTVEGVVYTETDLIRRKNMDNGFYTGNLNLDYTKGKLCVQTGAMYTLYEGDHFATLLWTEYNENIPSGYEWVTNHALKTDANMFSKAEYRILKGLNAYVDLQYRYVDYVLSGVDDDDMLDMSQHKTWYFFNPKAGLFYELNPFNKWFVSVAVAHREPTRADLKDAFKSGSSNLIRPEKLTDYEMGYTFDNQIFMASANLYFMYYKDQLVATGKLNDVGYKLMSNVDKSYRAGVELSLGYRPVHKLQLDANATVSRNRVVDYTAWYETYDNSTDWGSANQLSEHFDEAKLPFSPELIAAFSVTWKPINNFCLIYTKKYVGEQYITNTQNDNLKLAAYMTANLSLVYDFTIKGVNTRIGLYVTNLADQVYSCNAWGYEAHFANGDETYTEMGLYPVAPRNYSAKFTVLF